MHPHERAALAGGAIIVALSAAAVTESRVAFFAAFGTESGPCAALLTKAWRDPPCDRASRDVPYEQQLYTAAVDTIYAPRRAPAMGRGPAPFLLRRSPVSGARYLEDPKVASTIRGALPAGRGDDLVADFRAANARRTEFPALYLLQPTYLDAPTASRLLIADPSELARDPLLRAYSDGSPIDSLPGIVALSIPGVTEDGGYGMLYAELYERRSRTADHLEAAGFLLLRRDGARWLVTGEVPIPRKRIP